VAPLSQHQEKPMTDHSPLALPRAERLHGLDALRGLALLLGVALHASMSYLPGAEYWWIVSDSERSTPLAMLFYVIHLFRMPLFFLIAGYIGRMSLQRLGLRAFISDRCRRIVLPLLGFWPLVFSGIVVAVVWAAWIKGGGSLPAESPPGPRFTPDDFPLTHLWFLYVLTLFYAAALLLRAIAATIDRSGRMLGWVDAGVRLLFGPWAALLLAAPAAWCLATFDGWYAWFGVPTPDQSLYPNIPAVVSFGVAFGFGWLLQRQPALLLRTCRGWLGNLLLAAVAVGICWYLTGLTPPLVPAQPDTRKLIYALAYAIAGWAMTLALIGLALRFLADHSPARRYLADASYWIYLVHLPIVMLLQVAASQLDWPWWIEYPLLLALGLAVMLSSYEWMVRYSWIGAVLNGRRRQRGAPGAAPAHRGSFGAASLVPGAMTAASLNSDRASAARTVPVAMP
jgi:glucans biosynthesis protein C